MPKLTWQGGEPPEFPRDLTGLGPFRQRWHTFMSWMSDTLRRVFLRQNGHEDRIEALEASIPSLPVSIANGGTGQTSKTPAFDALAPGTTKGDLIAHDGTNHVRVGVGTDGFPLIAASAAAAGAAWATTKETITWWYDFDRRPIVGTAAASPPTLAVADGSINDATDGDGHFVGRDSTDKNFTWWHFQFPIPDELDLSEAVDAKVFFRLASNAAAGNQVQLSTSVRSVARDELLLSGGTLREVSGTIVLTGYSAGDLATCSIPGVLDANDAEANDFVKGVIQRNATAGNASDTYAATIRVTCIKFTGKRKVRT